VTTVIDGETTVESLPADTQHSDSIGAHLAMEVENRGPGSIVRLFTAGTIGPDGSPEWRLMKHLTLPFPLDKQGLSAVGDVLFAGSRYRDEHGAWHDVTRCDLVRVDNPVSEPQVPEILNESVPKPFDNQCKAKLVALPDTPTLTGGSWQPILTDAGSEPTVVNDSEGTRYVFYRDYDGSIGYMTAGEPLDKFDAGDLGGWSTAKAPVVVRDEDGLFHVFVIGSDGALWQKRQEWAGEFGDITWGEWTSLGGTPVDVAVGIDIMGRQEVYITGANGVLYHKWEDIEDDWHPNDWVPMSGPMGGAPAVTRHADGRQIIFMRGTDGALWTNSQALPKWWVDDPKWGVWTSLGGEIVGKPTAMIDWWNYVLVFTKGADGNIWSRTQTAPNTATFGDWIQRSFAGNAGFPIVATMADGGWDVFSRNADSSIMHMPQNTTLWATLAGYQPGWSGTPAVGLKHDGSMSVVAADYHGTLWESEVPPEQPGPPPVVCNGSTFLCDFRYDQVTFPATHNSFAKYSWDGSAPKFAVPNQFRTIPEQLDAGIRGMMLDLYYAYDELRLCHEQCDSLSGYITFSDTLAEIKNFLEANRYEVLTLIFENHVTAQQMAEAFEQAGLSEYLYVPDSDTWPTLGEMIAIDQRLVVLVQWLPEGFAEWENGAVPGYPWMLGEMEVGFETPYDYYFKHHMGQGHPYYCSIGLGTGQLFIQNHFIKAPSYVTADEVNSYDFLLKSMKYCREQRGRWANFIVVDFENCDSQYTCQGFGGHDGPSDVVHAAFTANEHKWLYGE
jgi:hypothetical protein